MILRNVLDGCDDAFVLRAAEFFFRPQRLTLHEGSLIAADEETIAGSQQPASPLVSMLGIPAEAEIDVMSTTMPSTTGSAATASTWRSISPPAGAGLRRSAK